MIHGLTGAAGKGKQDLPQIERHPPPMSSKLNIEQIDVNGDIRETAHEATEALAGDTRLGFLK